MKSKLTRSPAPKFAPAVSRRPMSAPIQVVTLVVIDVKPASVPAVVGTPYTWVDAVNPFVEIVKFSVSPASQPSRL